MKYSAEEIRQARETLLGWLKPGDTVYTILRHVSRGGATRQIGMVVLTPQGVRHPNHAVSVLLGLKRKGDGVEVHGGGMDMGFSIVYDLGRVLFPGGICEGHGNSKRPKHMAHGPVLGTDWPKGCQQIDSGYALRHEWL